MININADEHPGLHRYSLELAKYPELTETQYNSVISDLKQPEGSVLYQNARETLICSHLAMILGMAKDTYRKYYGGAFIIKSELILRFCKSLIFKHSHGDT